MAGKGGGGSWKVAYADFVTAMMAFFLAMWITAQDKKIREAIAHHFNAPFEAVVKKRPNLVPSQSLGVMPTHNSESAPRSSGGLADQPSGVEMEMLRQLNQRLLKVLATGAEQGNAVKLELTGSGLNVTVFNRSQKPVFEPQSSRLTEFGRWVFTTLAWEIARNNHLDMELEGHTTPGTLPNETEFDQWDLSSARANSARRLLVEHGVTTDRLNKVAGYADTQPLAATKPDDESNSRVTVLLSLKKRTPDGTSRSN
jgi:chemotaxis protein MotB